MNTLALTNKEQYPDIEILEKVLLDSFPIYQETILKLSDEDITIAWNYYNDGKAWLGKLMWKKKNLGWLHIYKGMFQVTVYFTEKYRSGIADIDIAQTTKSSFLQTSVSGKLYPLTVPVKQETDLTDLLCIIQYKKKCR